MVFNKKPSVLTSAESASIQTGEVPWDYQVQQVKVGDLIDGDMVLLPNNDRISNDQNFATGDSILVLSYMQATMKVDDQGKNDVTFRNGSRSKLLKPKKKQTKIWQS